MNDKIYLTSYNTCTHSTRYTPIEWTTSYAQRVGSREIPARKNAHRAHWLIPIETSNISKQTCVNFI